MISKIHSNPDDILDDLAEVASSVFNGLIHGSIQTREYFSNLKMPLNKPLAANMTRFHAKRFLSETRNPFAEYYLKEVGNNGISIKAGLGNIKVVKGRDGDAPSPNKTKKDERFYKQNNIQPTLFRDIFKPFASNEWLEFASGTSSLNLLLCWEADANYRITSLQMMCPRKIWRYRQSAEVFWKRFVPSPILTSSHIPNLNEEYEEVDDLEVFFDEEDLGTGTDD